MEIASKSKEQLNNVKMSSSRGKRGNLEEGFKLRITEMGIICSFGIYYS